MQSLTLKPIDSFRMDGSLRNLARPTVAEVDFREIAARLSRINRFNGGTRDAGYSVAQHCALGAASMYRLTGDRVLSALFLLHDAHEAYIGDMPTPVRDLICMHLDVSHGRDAAEAFVCAWGDIKAAWDEAIYAAAGLPAPRAWRPDWDKAVRDMDSAMTRAEAQDMIGGAAGGWSGWPRESRTRPAVLQSIRVVPWPAMKAEMEFLDLAHHMIGSERIAGSSASATVTGDISITASRPQRAKPVQAKAAKSAPAKPAKPGALHKFRVYFENGVQCVVTAKDPADARRIAKTRHTGTITKTKRSSAKVAA